MAESAGRLHLTKGWALTPERYSGLMPVSSADRLANIFPFPHRIQRPPAAEPSSRYKSDGRRPMQKRPLEFQTTNTRKLADCIVDASGKVLSELPSIFPEEGVARH